jgi:DNA polymerase-3 subunit epsilon/CBS domain-containing protein
VAAVLNATPLIALDAVVFDTETTGLDPRKARIVEMAAVRIRTGQIETGNPLQRLVQPGEPVPPEAARIHGIDDAALRGASGFREVWPEFRELLSGTVLIGHTIGFDLAMLASECRRAGFAWIAPRTLDTRLLAELVEPDLAGFGLDQLASWLKFPVEGRHSALADAIITARIFLALLPRLRERGIRTLAEAEQACRGLTAVLDDQHRAGWAEPVAPPVLGESAGTLARIETHTYRHRVRDVMTSPASFIDAHVALSEALARMAAEQTSSLFVRFTCASPDTPATVGIVTERDIMRALARQGSAALAQSVGAIASRPLRALPADAFVYRAIARLSRLRIRHLGVSDDRGRIVGALSARDLLRVRGVAGVSLGDEIDEAEDVPSLGHSWAKLPHVAAALFAEGLSSREIAAVISTELGALTQRAAVIAERRMAEAGRGSPPSAYAIAVLGSAGRGESLLAMDQDNALVFAEGDPGGPEDSWFEALAVHIADILHEVGVPYCQGGVMAKNPLWRGSLATWRARVAHWISGSAPQDLLSVDIFFDLRAVHGETDLATSLWHEACAAAHKEAAFAKLLAEAAGSVEPAIGLFGTIKTQQGRIDLKKAGLFGIVTAARVLAIRHHVVERATPARLQGIRALDLGGERDLEAFDEAHATFVDLILRQQIEDIDRGRRPSNSVAVKSLSRRDRERLRAALNAVQPVETLVRDLLFRG